MLSDWHTSTNPTNLMQMDCAWFRTCVTGLVRPSSSPLDGSSVLIKTPFNYPPASEPPLCLFPLRPVSRNSNHPPGLDRCVCTIAVNVFTSVRFITVTAPSECKVMLLSERSTQRHIKDPSVCDVASRRGVKCELIHVFLFFRAEQHVVDPHQSHQALGHRSIVGRGRRQFK